MSEAIAFDTHRFIKRLTATGFTEQQAEALADEQVTLLNANLATKADIAEIEAALKSDIARVEADLKSDIARIEATIVQVEATLKSDITQAKHEITKWMVGFILGVAAVQTTLIVGLLS